LDEESSKAKTKRLWHGINVEDLGVGVWVIFGILVVVGLQVVGLGVDIL
jgi:hypothetical protein